MEVVGVVEEIDVVEGAMDEGGGGVLLGQGVEGGDPVVAEGIGIVVDDEGDPLANDDDDDTTPSASVNGGGRRRRMSKKEEMAERLEAALQAYNADLYPSVRQCALAFRVCISTFNNLVKDPDKKYVGKGRVSTVFSSDEEDRIARHIKERMQIGCGMDIMQVRMTQ